MTDGVLHLDPRLATGWNRLRFSLTHQGVPATVTLTPTTATVEADGGSIDVALPGVRTTARARAPGRVGAAGRRLAPAGVSGR